MAEAEKAAAEANWAMANFMSAGGVRGITDKCSQLPREEVLAKRGTVTLSLMLKD